MKIKKTKNKKPKDDKKHPHKPKKPKLLFIVKNRIDSYGVSIGLINSAGFVVNALRKKGYDADIVRVTDANEIDRVVTLRDPDIVMVEALFVTPDKFAEILSIPRHKRRKWVVRLHSKAPFLAHESMAFDWLNEYKKVANNLYISCNNEDFNEDLVNLGYSSSYLPNIYSPRDYHCHNTDHHKGDYVDVGCFGAIRSLKNQVQQAIAAIEFAKKIGRKLRFHINSSRVESKSEPELKNLRALFAGQKNATLVEWNWLSHQGFVQVVRRMDVSMQVSFSESFNIVTADAVGQNVPVVVSQDIDWIPSVYRAIPTDTRDIVDKLILAYKLPKLNAIVCNRALDKYNERALVIWERYLLG
jgi:hypothetical protein